MKAIPAFLRRSLVALLALVHIPVVLSQTHQWNSTNGNWNNSGNWSTSTVPSGTGTAVSFHNTSGAVYDVYVADANPTVGSVTATGNANNNVRLGHATEFSGTLTLAATDPAGSPLLNVGSGIRLAIFCELAGNQGFTKSGTGILNFNTNNLTMLNLNGDVRISGGAITISEAGNLGTGNITFTGSGILELVAGRTANHSANKTLTINPGATATLTNLGGTARTIFNGPISGSGSITFNAGNFTLNGFNTFNGSARLWSSRVVLGENRTLTSGPITLLGTCALDLGNRLQTFSGFQVEQSVSTQTQAVFSNGSLLVQGTGPLLLGGGASQTSVDFTQLSAVTMNCSTGNITLPCAPFAASTNNTLSLSSSGTNSLQARLFTIGGIGNSIDTRIPDRRSILRLGASNNIQANSLIIGQSGAMGSIAFQTGNGNLTLGTGNWTIGHNTFGGALGNGDVNMGNGTLEASFTNLILANHTSTLGPNLSGTLAFSRGNLTGTTLIMSRKASDGVQDVASSINQSGGTTTVMTLTMGSGGNSTASLRPTFNLTGGTLAAWTINASGGNFHATLTNRTLSISGNATLRNRIHGNLTISGLNTTPAGRINLLLSGPANFIADTTRTFSIGQNALLSGSGNVTKSGGGILSISGSIPHTYNGTITGTQGEIAVGAQLPAASLTLSSGTVSGNGTLGNIRLAGGSLDQGPGIGNFSSGNLTWNSNATIRLDLSGSNSSDRINLSGSFSKGSGSAFTFDFKGGGIPSGSYTLVNFASHSFSSSDFRAINLGPGLSGVFSLGNNSLTFNVSGNTPQTIGNFTTITDKVATDAPFSVTPPATSSGLPVTLSIKSGNATISGNLVTLTGTGPVFVAANQPGNAAFAAALEVTTTFIINRAPQTINPFSVISNRRIGEGSFSISPPTSSSGLPVVVSSRSGPVTVVGNTITPTGTGVVVLAANQAGNATYLAAAEVTTSLVVMNNLATLTVVPPAAEDGSISLGFAGQTEREIGTAFTITATPTQGMRFARWTNNGTQISTSATTTFTMQTGMVLQPVFTPDFNTLRGIYNGLVGTGDVGTGTADEMAAFPANNGYIAMNIVSTGNFTGNLTLGNQTSSFSGSFSENKSTSFSVIRNSGPPAMVSLNLNPSLPGSTSGTISIDNSTLPFVAAKGSYTDSLKVYTVLLPAPPGIPLGHSYATITLNPTGNGAISGRIATNEQFTTSHYIVDSGAGQWVLPFYIRTSVSGNNTGLILGEAVVAKNPVQGPPEATMSVEWLRNASPGAQFFPNGFLTSINGRGNSLVTLNGTSMLSRNSQSANFTLMLDPGRAALSSTINQKGVWTSNNTMTMTPPVSSGLWMIMSHPSLGRFQAMMNGNIPCFGVVVSPPVELFEGGPVVNGAGYFMWGGSSVPLLLTSP